MRRLRWVGGAEDTGLQHNSNGLQPNSDGLQPTFEPFLAPHDSFPHHSSAFNAAHADISFRSDPDAKSSQSHHWALPVAVLVDYLGFRVLCRPQVRARSGFSFMCSFALGCARFKRENQLQTVRSYSILASHDCPIDLRLPCIRPFHDCQILAIGDPPAEMVLGPFVLLSVLLDMEVLVAALLPVASCS